MTDITYRQFQESDAESTLELFAVAFGKPRDVQQWRWEYLSGPEKSCIVVAEADNKIVGHYAILPRSYRIGDEVLTIGLVVDVVTHPDYGRRGIFVQSASKAFEVAKNAGISLLVGFPNEAAIRGHRKAGWDEVGTIRVLARPLRASAITKSLRMSSRVFEMIVDIALDALAKISTTDHDSRIQVSQVAADDLPGLGGEYMELLDDSLAKSSISNSRNPEWLAWRLSDPVGSHNVLVARNTRTRQIVGCCILNVKEYKHLLVGAIMDLIVRDSHAEVGKLLLAEAIKRARSRGCELLLAMQSPAGVSNPAFMSKMVVPTPRRLQFIVRNTDGSPLKPRYARIENWHIQLIDHDVI